MRLPSILSTGLVMAGFSALFSNPVHALVTAGAGENTAAADRFGGPLNPGDVFPTTMEPLHPLNPAELARSTETMLQFGIQSDGRSLILGLPNFLLAISSQSLDWTRASGAIEVYEAKKYELGYGISTADLGFTAEDAPSAALGFNLRYLDYLPHSGLEGNRVEKAYGDIGISGSYKRFRADFALLNLAKLSGGNRTRDSLPGQVPKEYNFGLAYGMPSNWLVSARLGIQDTSRGQSIVDVGFEKLFFQNVTFRIGSQRRYAFGDGNAAKEVKSSLSGGVWYRLNTLGTGYRYPERDADLFSVGTVVRMLRNIEMGGLVMLTKTPGETEGTSKSNTSLLMTVGKSF